MSDTARRTDDLVTALALVIVTVFQIYGPLRTATNDATLFAYGGKLILQGLVPYRDFWDNKPPAIFYTHALGFLLSGGHWLGPTILQSAASITTVLVASRFFRDVFEPGPARWAALLVCAVGIGNPYLTQGGNLTEPYQVLPIIVSAWLLRPFDAEVASRRWFLAGAAAAAAFLYKPTGAAIGVVAIGVVALHLARGRWAPRHAAKMLGAYVAGGLGVLVLVTAAFGFAGCAGDFWFATLEYNVTAYRELFGWQPTVWSVKKIQPIVNPRWVQRALLLGLVLAPFAALARGRAVGRSARTEDVVVLGVAWAAADVYFAFVTGYAYPHYFVPLALSLPFVAATLAFPAGARSRWRTVALAPGVVVGVLLVLDLRVLALNLVDLRSPERAFVTTTEDELLASQAAPFLDAGEPILSWGHHHGPQLALGHPPSTGVLSSLHLGSTYGWHRWGPQFEAALQRRPAVIIDTAGSLARTPVDGGLQGLPRPFFEALDRVVREEYVALAETSEKHRVFVRRDRWQARAAPAAVAPDPAR